MEIYVLHCCKVMASDITISDSRRKNYTAPLGHGLKVGHKGSTF